MTHSVARSGMTLLLCSMAIPATAAQSEQTLQPSAAPPPPAATYAPLSPLTGVAAAGEQGANAPNRLMFVTGDQASEFSQRMRERFADPEQRVAMRAEQRAALVSQHAAVGRLVGLDPVTEQKLIELLTDQQMERLEQVYAQPRPNFTDMQKYADETTQRMNRLRELLGDEKLERFQDFERSQSGRYWVGQLSAGLAPADQLQPEQQDRLTALKQEQYKASSVAVEPWRAFRAPMGPGMSVEDMQRNSQRQARIASENSWRNRQVGNRVLEQKAAAFLTSVQLAELSRYQAQEQDNLRRFVESARAAAGLDPKIPDMPELEEDTPKLIDAWVQIEVSINVNREPTTVTRTVRTGESFTFDAAQGLIVEATPTMYDDDWIAVHLRYYEEGATGRRRLSGSSISTARAGQSDGGGGGTVITGRKGYAIETSVNAKVL